MFSEENSKTIMTTNRGPTVVQNPSTNEHDVHQKLGNNFMRYVANSMIEPLRDEVKQATKRLREAEDDLDRRVKIMVEDARKTQKSVYETRLHDAEKEVNRVHEILAKMQKVREEELKQAEQEGYTRGMAQDNAENLEAYQKLRVEFLNAKIELDNVRMKYQAVKETNKAILAAKEQEKKNLMTLYYTQKIEEVTQAKEEMQKELVEYKQLCAENDAKRVAKHNEEINNLREKLNLKIIDLHKKLANKNALIANLSSMTEVIQEIAENFSD
jgi:hypothetical protein